MSTRVSLVDRLEKDKQQLDPNVEAAFIKGGDVPGHPHEISPDDSDRRQVSVSVDAVSKPGSRLKEPAVMMPGLIAVNVRIRPELARALKTASLDRQIQGIQPCSKREIVEEALEPWLRNQGYLAD